MRCHSIHPDKNLACESKTAVHKFCVAFDPTEFKMIHWPNDGYVPLKTVEAGTKTQRKQSLEEKAAQIDLSAARITQEPDVAEELEKLALDEQLRSIIIDLASTHQPFTIDEVWRRVPHQRRTTRINAIIRRLVTDGVISPTNVHTEEHPSQERQLVRCWVGEN